MVGRVGYPQQTLRETVSQLQMEFRETVSTVHAFVVILVFLLKEEGKSSAARNLCHKGFLLTQSEADL